VNRLRKLMSKMLRAGISPSAWKAKVKVLRGLGMLPQERREKSWPPKRIFFAYPYFSVGDLILAIPLLERIHALWPDAQIDVAMGGPMAEIVESLPFIHRVDRMVRPVAWIPLLQDYAEAAAILRQFRQSPAATLQYDLAIAPRWSWHDGFLAVFQAYLTGAPVRCGYSRMAYGCGPHVDLLLTHAALGGVGEVESHRYARLLARCGLEPEEMPEYDPLAGIPSLQRIAEERVRTGKALQVDAPYIVLSPGATKGAHTWPVERFAEFARWVQQQYGWPAVVIGSLGDVPVCDALVADAGKNARSLGGKTTALTMLDVIAGAKLFLGNDSGPAHISGALGIPTLVPNPFPRSFTGEHINAPSRFRPTGSRVRVLQPDLPTAPCTAACEMQAAHCILAVDVAQVIDAAKELISKP
jgi:ADP-heptose:LPS heptosyltransferase